MTRRILRLIALFVFIICASTGFGACAPLDKAVEFFSDDGTGHIFKIAIECSPGNLDPQLATDSSSITVAKNLFAGLMGYDASGKLVGRLAEDYSISEDGLVYTFDIAEGYSWYATGDFSAPVTAGDFVFAFQRLMDPKTASTHSAEYFCIAGAAAARGGAIPPEEIGVTATGEYTLEFRLEHPNAEFLYLLAELPAMPCCREFFENEAGGKYGLEAESTCSNGPFYLRYWLHDPYGTENYVRLRRNPGYSEMSYVSPAGINYLVNPDYDSRSADFLNDSTELMLYQPTQRPSSDKNTVAGYSEVAGIVFNEKIAAFSDPEVRQVFSWAADREKLRESVPEIIRDAYYAVPDSDRIALRGYSPSTEREVTESDPAMAEYKWSFILGERERSELIGMTVLVPDSFEYLDCLDALTDVWYDSLGIHFGAEVVNERDYKKRIADGDFGMALVFLDSSDASPLGYIAPFSRGDFGIKLDKASSALGMRGSCKTLSALNYACADAEKQILSEYHFIPLWELPTVLALDDDAADIYLDPFSRTVYFEDGKMF